jgi:hypothetical protein
MRQQIWQTVLNRNFLGDLIERCNCSIQGLIPVRGRDTAAPVALYNVSDLDQRVSELYVVLHPNHPSMAPLLLSTLIYIYYVESIHE